VGGKKGKREPSFSCSEGKGRCSRGDGRKEERPLRACSRGERGGKKGGEVLAHHARRSGHGKRRIEKEREKGRRVEFRSHREKKRENKGEKKKRSLNTGGEEGEENHSPRHKRRGGKKIKAERKKRGKTIYPSLLLLR